MHDLTTANFAPLIPEPSKVVCVGLNYRNHILEMGRELPEFHTLLPQYSASLIGAHDPIMSAAESDSVGWEAELAVIIGSTVPRARGSAAEQAIGGFAILNDVTMRDWQYRTPIWDQ